MNGRCSRKVTQRETVDKAAVERELGRIKTEHIRSGHATRISSA